MRLDIAGNLFQHVEIPVLWGTRAVLQDAKGRVSVVDLSGQVAKLEVLGDQPAPGTTYTVEFEGFTVTSGSGAPLYTYVPGTHSLVASASRLPDLEIGVDAIRVGTNTFSANMVVGSDVGLVVTEQGVGFGGRLPAGLAALRIAS